jgi:hypothetical protein
MNSPSLVPSLIVALSSGSNSSNSNPSKEDQLSNVVEFHPTALATVVGLPFQYSPGEGGRWQAMLRLRRYVRELESLEESVISQLFGLYGPEKSVREAARHLRMTPEAVARIEERALGELRRQCGTKPAFSEAA